MLRHDLKNNFKSPKWVIAYNQFHPLSTIKRIKECGKINFLGCPVFRNSDSIGELLDVLGYANNGNTNNFH
jgi:hypothetical protein